MIGWISLLFPVLGNRLGHTGEERNVNSAKLRFFLAVSTRENVWGRKEWGMNDAEEGKETISTCNARVVVHHEDMERGEINNGDILHVFSIYVK